MCSECCVSIALQCFLNEEKISLLKTVINMLMFTIIIQFYTLTPDRILFRYDCYIRCKSEPIFSCFAHIISFSDVTAIFFKIFTHFDLNS